MSRIPPIPIEQLNPELANKLQSGLRNRMLSAPLPIQVWAHRNEQACKWLDLLASFQSSDLLEARLKELVRLKIASITQCKACQIARKSDDVDEEDIACLSYQNEHFTPSEQVALQYAELFAGDYMAIDNLLYETLYQHFTTPEVVELSMYCALMLAGGRMTYVQQAYEDSANES
ncbi:carboxymuconolactone decarboxylase [Glaciecola sp. 4H-3-7+YE-5]|jgi:alkylhydroperoxidase family enzyme|uniref:carboxymuconolactone decarboxylase family protein n=1 Tax=uncultured Alteromonas sp. TaxID=179113 RepID=UPI00020A71B3|nr:carboxymuconolactone decarboxylase [Glaciecola sp. 4H-3-7+YE-5]|tara:strand:- start:31 stop:555 length:525 start_codon:yes stop_codon:yes gene_type:complete